MIKFFNKKVFNRLPDAFLFDTDNTLYPYEKANIAAQRAVREKIIKTLSISSKQFDKAYLQARHKVKQRIPNSAASHSRLLYMQNMIESFGLGSQVLLALDFEQTYWRTFMTNALLFPSVKDLLDDIRVLGIPVSMVTDLTAQIQFRKVIYFELDKYFDYIVTSEESGFDKPHEASFLLALDKMKPKGNCVWMIGDNPINDIGGAKKSINAVTLQKIHNGVKVGKGENRPDASFQNFNDLRKLLKTLKANLCFIKK